MKDCETGFLAFAASENVLNWHESSIVGVKTNLAALSTKIEIV